MCTLGQQFKTAREAKGVSQSEAGSATNILTKLIVTMEADDFSLMPAPTYAKGFIRLYANYLGLDPAPLVEEYLKKNLTTPRPLMDEHSQLEQNSRRVPLDSPFKQLMHHWPKNLSFDRLKPLFSKRPHAQEPADPAPDRETGHAGWKDIRVLAGIGAAVILFITLIGLISTCTRQPATTAPIAAPKTLVPPPHMLIDDPLPELYLINPGTLETE